MLEKVNNIKKELKEIWENESSRSLILSLLGMFFSVLASEIMTYDNNIIKSYTGIMFIVLFVLSFCFNCIFNKKILGFIITYVYVFLLSTVDYFVYKATSNHFTVANLLSAKTAQSIFSKNYLQVNLRFFIAIGIFIIAFICIVKSKNKKKVIRDKKMTIICSFILVVLFFVIVFTNTLSKITITEGMNFSHRQVEDSTYLVYFHSGINDVVVNHVTKKDIETSEKILSSYKDNNKEVEVKPNIIIIMCEALTDYYIYEDFKTTNSYMPYIQSLQREYKSGYIIPPYIGGGTCDSEFEFLTGMSITNVSLQAMSYNRYLNKPEQTFPSLVSNFKQQGYLAIAMHPGSDISYNRDIVYKCLQFDEIYFNETIEMTSDKYLFDFIQKNINEKDEPLFQFAVTIFNHSPYEADGKEIDFLNVECDKDFEAKMNRYLTNASETDKYLEEFIKNIKEPTIVVIFGDHQPALSEEPECTFIDEENKSKVPYIIWSNCNYEFEEIPEELSGNYFGSHLLNSLDYPLSSFMQYQLDISKNNANIRDESLEKNTDYEAIQKYYLFYKDMNKNYFE